MGVVNKVTEGRPDVSDMLKNQRIDLIINTTEGRRAIADSAVIRRLALQRKVCYTTTLTGGEAISIALRYKGASSVRRPAGSLRLICFRGDSRADTDDCRG